MQSTVPGNEGLVGAGLVLLINDFHRGGRLDGQRGLPDGPATVAYGNYTYGAFISSAGFSLDSAIMAASLYGWHQSRTTNAYAKEPNMGGGLKTVLEENVYHITAGFNATDKGALCR